MSTLKKGDLVMFEGQLSIVEEYTKGKTILLIFILAAKNGLVVRIDEVIKATRPQVEEYISTLAFANIDGEWLKLGNKYRIELVNGDYEVFLNANLSLEDFDTAPAMQAEAILVARLLNATKD